MFHFTSHQKIILIEILCIMNNIFTARGKVITLNTMKVYRRV